MSIKPPTVLIAVILVGSVNVACYHPTKSKAVKSCHIHTDNKGRKVAKHCHLYGNDLKHEHPYRYRNL